MRPLSFPREQLLVLGALLVFGACADKVYAPPRTANPTIPVRIAMQGAGGTRTVSVRAEYERVGSARVLLKEQQFQAQTGEQQIAMSIDLTDCLADAQRVGSQTGCDLMLGIGLYDNTATLLDTLSLGPFAATPGRALDVVDANLAAQRFAVREWLAEDALRLGGSDGPPSIRTVSGYTNQLGVAVPLIIQNPTDETGQQRASLYTIEGGAWRRMLAVPGTAFFDVFGVSATEIWLSALDGLYRYDGTTLTKIPGISDSLFTVSARIVSGNRLVVAAGNGGAMWTGDGTTWQQHNFTAERFRDACVSSLTEAFAGTFEGNVYRYDGNNWTLTSTPVPALKNGMQCPGPGQAFVYDTASALTWDGANWVDSPHPGQGLLINWALPDGGGPITVAARRDQFGGSFETLMMRFANGTWQETGTLPFAQPFSFNPTWVNANSAGFVVHGGFSRVLSVSSAGTPGVLTYQPALRDVAVTSPSHAVAVGWNLFLARWNGSRWTIDPPPADERRSLVLHGVWSDGPNNAWAVGNAPVAYHWNGSSWNTVIPSTANIFGAQGAGPHDVWGVGNTVFMAGSQLIRCVGEQCAVQAPSPGGLNMYGIWGSSLTNVFAVGELGTIVRYDGTSWTQMTSPTTRNLRNVWGSGPNDVWALGDSVLVRYDGNSWQTVAATGALLQALTGPSTSQAIVRSGLWVGSAGEVYVGGDNGRVARYNGYTWQLMQTPTTRRIIAIHGLTGLGALAIGDGSAAHAGPTMLRGAGVTGTFATAMPPPLTWY